MVAPPADPPGRFSVHCREEGWFSHDGTPVVYDSAVGARSIMAGLQLLFPARHYEVRPAPERAEPRFSLDIPRYEVTVRCSASWNGPMQAADPGGAHDQALVRLEALRDAARALGWTLAPQHEVVVQDHLIPRPGFYCGAETTLRQDEHRLAQCHEPKGHLGPHRDPRDPAPVEWTDSTTRFPEPP